MQRVGGGRAYRRTADAKINVVIALQDEPQHVFGKHRTDSRLAAVTADRFFFSSLTQSDISQVLFNTDCLLWHTQLIVCAVKYYISLFG